MRLLALTRGPDTPSARFRFRQYLPTLAESGIDCVERYPPHGATAPPGSRAVRLRWLAETLPSTAAAPVVARRFDTVLLQKPLLTNRRSVEPLLPAGYAFDVDDATWLRSPKGVDAIARRAGVVIAGNEFIAEHFASLAPTVVIPTGVDLDRWHPAAGEAVADGPPTIVWSGGHTGFADLAIAAPALRRVLARHPQVRLRIMADLEPPTTLGLPAERVDYLPWSREVEVEALNSATVGMMPLRDSDWARGKCAYKMLLYLACGIPAVASGVGMNAEVAGVAPSAVTLADSDDEWVAALESRLTDPAGSARDGASGRVAIRPHYGTDATGHRLASVLHSLPERRLR
ncbi:MAG: glycosyltransferase [Actinobacteria bacterium]|nr:glycosyltransferase [Actinomycetota bacterium]MCB9411255.1 glycosyltransferase [Actinomycetota bacterium]